MSALLARLESIQSSDVPSPRLPVIDRTPPDCTKEALPGLRFLRDEVKRDCELLRQHANTPPLSTNAPYLIAVWDELVHVRQPIAMYRMFSPAGRDRARAVKVDVVAENGASWVRVNTIKNTRLMMEFREIDSYLTSDEDETGPRLAQTEFDNSVLRMGRELLAAAKANPVFSSSGTTTPRVTIRLTRLDPLKDDASDPRIGKTIQCLRDMGIDVQLGERPYPDSAPTPAAPKRLVPTTNINLDLSALIALISDISHSPLPQSEEEACARFEPPQSYLDWKKARVKSLARQNGAMRHSLHDAEDGGGNEGSWESSGQHSRALAAQAIQEMNMGILEEIHERVSAHTSTNATFWTTNEARHRCLQIVSKIGGERERLRADALLGSTLCACTPPVPVPAHIRTNSAPRTDNGKEKASSGVYWEHSRYPAGFLPLIPVRVYPSVLPKVKNEGRQSQPIFFEAFAQTCTGILAQEAALEVLERAAEEIPDEIPPAAQTSLPKLTVHTVASMLAGASRGYTTLTTNRSSVKAVLKEMRRVCARGSYESESVGEVEKAALWILDPRSLSEGMRSKR